MAAVESILHCSFCGRSQHDVHKLVAGPATYICDACSVLTIEIISATSGTDEELLALVAKLARSTDVVVEQLRAAGVPWARIQEALRP